MGEKECGKVRWFRASKGFGFIARDAGGGDIFVHYSGIDGDGYRELHRSQMVEFEVIETAKGLQAINVKVVG